VGTFFLRLPTEDRYFEVVTGVGSPEEVTITEVFIPPTAVLENATPKTVVTTEAPYTHLLEDYTALVTSQYQLSTKFLDWLRVSLRMLTYSDDVTNNLQVLFDINDTIVEYADQLGILVLQGDGTLVQEAGEYTPISDYPNPVLDIIGTIVGCPRKIKFQPTDPTVSPVLDDETYKKLLRATIGKNNWDGNIDSLQPLWKELFGGGSIQVVDNLDMSITITASAGLTSIVYDLIMNDYIVPRPQAVWITGFGLPVHPLWGWGYDNVYIGGWNHGYY